jgi:hypothetical protein
VDARWNDPQFGNYYAWVEIGNKIPIWGPTFRTSNKLVDQEYEQFIGSLDLPIADPTEKKKALVAQKKWSAALDQLNALQAKVGTNWKAFHESEKDIPLDRQTTFDTWLASHDGTKIGAAVQNIHASAQNYSHYFGQAYKGYAFAANLIPEFYNTAYQLAALAPDGSRLTYRTYNISPDLGEWIETSKKTPANAPPKFSFSYDRAKGHTHVEDTRFGGSAGFGGFIGIRVGGNYNKHTVDSTREGFRMAFSARNIGQFTVTPGKWFSATAVATFKNGPFVPGAVIKGPDELWGPKGRFNLMTTTLIVAYQPSVVAALSSVEYHLLKEAYGGGASISIGPFSFGGSYQKNVEDVKFDDATNTVTAANLSDVPEIIAVVCSELPDFTK